jgi:predicted HicB family RNase H-like nuclease
MTPSPIRKKRCKMPSKKSAKSKLVKQNPVDRVDPLVPLERRPRPLARSSGQARSYVKIVEWSPEDDCFVGSAPPLVGRCCHGDREEEVFAELSQIVEEWLAIHASDSKTLPAALSTKRYSGKFQLRLTPDLHRLLALRAAMSRRSINDLAVEAIERAVAPSGG